MASLPKIAAGSAGAIGALASLFHSDEAEAGIYGQKALKANIDKMMKARELLDNGFDEDQVFKSTGWYKSKIDGQMKFESPDTGAELAPNWDKHLNSPHQSILGGILKHDELYENYPEMFDYPIRGGLSGALKGSFQDFGKMIALNTNRPEKDVFSTLLHEIQHGVQYKEGFSKGGNDSQFYPRPFKEQMEKYEQKVKRYNSMNRVYQDRVDGWDQKTALRNWEVLDKKLEELTDMRELMKQYEPYQQYRRLGGEAEARMVQKRLDPEERLTRGTPESSLDMPIEDVFHSAKDSPIHGSKRPSDPEEYAKWKTRIKKGQMSDVDRYGEIKPLANPTTYNIGQALDKIDTPFGNPLGGTRDLLQHLGTEGFQGSGSLDEIAGAALDFMPFTKKLNMLKNTAPVLKLIEQYQNWNNDAR